MTGTDFGPDGTGAGGAAAGLGAGGGVICLAERDGAAIAEASLRALAFAASLAGPAQSVTAVVFPPAGGVGEPEPDDEVFADVLAECGATDVCLVRSAELTAYAPVAWARSIEQLTAADRASAVVAAATDHGSEVLAHLGAMTGLPVAANCVSAQSAGPSSWRLVRQRWAGSVLEDAVLEASLALLTVAADAVGQPAADGAASAVNGAVSAVNGAVLGGNGAASGVNGAESADRGLLSSARAGRRPSVRTVTPVLSEPDLVVRATESAEQSSGMSLATARVVVGGGRGVGGPDGFSALEELADLLGGVVGVSRVVTSQGWRPHRQQVGQTGTKISPELYMACGISGAIQHMAGCLSARHIVAVNTDADAPIIAHAEFAVIGDLNEVVPALIAAIRARAS
ncbi:MAG TPA: FAD-binding protein [Streptosporangiaceae bacterium]|nr:FAD-binding protein [Streptosporangiaceae bacterium]